MTYIRAMLYEEIKRKGINIGSFPIIKNVKNKHTNQTQQQIVGSKPNQTAYTYKGLQIYVANNRIIIQKYQQCERIKPIHITDTELEAFFFNGLEKGIKAIKDDAIKRANLKDLQEYERLKQKFL